ncbi:hypothetical protein [Lentzea sp.]|uniref:hypothetical protein n=1 Tax=Lentzea sp. TaxID=56099 RepID=UPI002ED489E2
MTNAQPVQNFQVQGGNFWIGGNGSPKTGFITIDKTVTGKPGTPPMREVGAQIEIAFTPDRGAVHREIQTVSLVQVVLDTVRLATLAGGAVVPRQHNIGYGTFAVPNGQPHQDWTIDQDVFDKAGAVRNRDPRYAQNRLTDKDKISTEDPKKGVQQTDVSYPGSGGGRPSHGFSVGRGTDGGFKGSALLRDQPTVKYDPAVDTAAGGMSFEIAALADPTARQPAQWLGSVTWGFTLAPAGPVLVPIAVVAGGPSPAFLAAAAQWNATPAGGAPMLPLP